MTPQLQQAIKILQLSLPELEAIVQSELDANPMLEPLDQSPAEAAANRDGDDPNPWPPRRWRTPGTRAGTRRRGREFDGDWEPGGLEEQPASNLGD